MERARLKSCSSLHLQRRLSSGNFSGVTSKAEFHSGQDGTFKPLGSISMWAPCFLMWAVWLLRSRGAPRRQEPPFHHWPPRSLTPKSVSVDIKVKISAICLRSCLLWGAGSWDDMSVSQLRKLQGASMRHLRRASGNHKGHGGPTDLQIREQLTQPSVQSFLARSLRRWDCQAHA